MGNRAVIAFEKCPKVGIYLHWNGGVESVQAFLDYAKEQNVQDDGDYAIARLVQIIGNFFGGTLSIGVNLLENLDTDNGDNGLYWVNDWKIVRREYAGDGPGFSESQYTAMLKAVRKANHTPFVNPGGNDKYEEVADALREVIDSWLSKS